MDNCDTVLAGLGSQAVRLGLFLIVFLLAFGVEDAQAFWRLFRRLLEPMEGEHELAPSRLTTGESLNGLEASIIALEGVVRQWLWLVGGWSEASRWQLRLWAKWLHV